MLMVQALLILISITNVCSSASTSQSSESNTSAKLRVETIHSSAFFEIMSYLVREEEISCMVAFYKNIVIMECLIESQVIPSYGILKYIESKLGSTSEEDPIIQKEKLSYLIQSIPQRNFRTVAVQSSGENFPLIFLNIEKSSFWDTEFKPEEKCILRDILHHQNWLGEPYDFVNRLEVRKRPQVFCDPSKSIIAIKILYESNYILKADRLISSHLETFNEFSCLLRDLAVELDDLHLALIIAFQYKFTTLELAVSMAKFIDYHDMQFFLQSFCSVFGDSWETTRILELDSKQIDEECDRIKPLTSSRAHQMRQRFGSIDIPLVLNYEFFESIILGLVTTSMDDGSCLRITSTTILLLASFDSFDVEIKNRIWEYINQYAVYNRNISVLLLSRLFGELGSSTRSNASFKYDIKKDEDLALIPIVTKLMGGLNIRKERTIRHCFLDGDIRAPLTSHAFDTKSAGHRFIRSYNMSLEFEKDPNGTLEYLILAKSDFKKYFLTILRSSDQTLHRLRMKNVLFLIRMFHSRFVLEICRARKIDPTALVLRLPTLLISKIELRAKRKEKKSQGRPENLVYKCSDVGEGSN